MSPDFRIVEAHLYPAEPAGSTRTTEAIDGERDRGSEIDRGAYITSFNSRADLGASVILTQK